jgi:tetratricopeptide (TPR) repeat protein
MHGTKIELPDFDRLWDYSKPAETEVAFRELLPTAESSGDLSYLVQLLTQIGRAEGLQRRFDDAHSTLDRAWLLLNSNLKPAEVRYLLERGRVLNSSGNPEEARPLFLEAFDMAQECGEDYHAVDAAHMMGVIEPDPAAQMEWNSRALHLAERSDDPYTRRWLGSLYNNMGWTLHDEGKYNEALELFQRAALLRKEQNQPREERIARWCVARTLRSLGRLDEALSMQEQLLAEHSAAGDESGFVHEELAECLLALGRDEEARPHARKAHEILSQDPWLIEADPARLERLKALA